MAASQKKKGRVSKAEAERRRRAAREAARKKRSGEAASLALLALGALLTALAFVEGEGVWNAARTALFGVFGALFYAVGPLTAALSVASALGKGPSGFKAFSWFMLLLSASGAVYLFGDSRATDSFAADVLSLYETGCARVGGGAVSALVGRTLESLCGLTAGRIAAVLLILVFALVATGRTVTDIVSGAAKPIEKLKNAREERRFERYNEELEEPEEKTPTTHAGAPEDDDLAPWLTRRRPKKSWLFRQPRDIDIPIDSQPAAAKAESDRQTAPTPEFESAGADGGPEILASRERALDRPETVERDSPAGAAHSGIDIPLGPDFDPSAPDPLSDVDILTKDGVPTGPAAGVVKDIFGRARAMDETFADFSASGDDRSASSPFFETDSPASSPDGDEPLIGAERENEPAAPELGWEPPEPEEQKKAPYRFPPAALLDRPEEGDAAAASEELRATADKLVSILGSFGVDTKVVDYSRGPTVTRYELQPEPGVRLSRIVNLSDDLALNLAADGVRIEAPIPGKAALGIEVPNRNRTSVRLRTAVESEDFKKAPSPLAIALGQDIAGRVRIGDISKMPHLLIAGATGMGKSVCINSIILSLVYKSSPDEVQLVLVDPKLVEFTCYAGLPHLHTPVVTDPKKAAGALGAAVAEMQRRYKLFSELGARNIEEYNRSVKRYKSGEGAGSQEEADLAERLELKPRIVIIIDELNDLMMTAPNEVEDSICRLAQMGRAAGVHLVVATQRPSVDVITGTIKNNIPTRIAFKVSSQVDSRTILDTSGAEKLIGNGDMLFLPVGATKPMRLQGCFVSDEEVARVAAYLKKYSSASYNDEFIRETEENAARESGRGAQQDNDGADPMLEQAMETVIEARQASTSLLQRKLRLGYSRAARIMDEMEELGVIGPADGSRPREVRMTRQQFQERLMNAEGRE